MTFKRADRLGWPRLRARQFVCQAITDAPVQGYATLLHMVEVAEPLWVTHNEQRVRIADVGYSWLQIFPDGAKFTHTTMFDPDGQPVQEYIDIVAEQGIGQDGIPWYDDLYLDITWIPEGSPLLLDQEELEAAHAIGAVNQEQYELARGETARLLVALTVGDYTLPELARALYPTLRAALETADTPTEPVAMEGAPDTPDTPETPETPETPVDATNSAMAEETPVAPEQPEQPREDQSVEDEK